jgi:hypothetical protein
MSIVRARLRRRFIPAASKCFEPEMRSLARKNSAVQTTRLLTSGADAERLGAGRGGHFSNQRMTALFVRLHGDMKCGSGEMTRECGETTRSLLLEDAIRRIGSAKYIYPTGFLALLPSHVRDE